MKRPITISLTTHEWVSIQSRAFGRNACFCCSVNGRELEASKQSCSRSAYGKSRSGAMGSSDSGLGMCQSKYNFYSRVQFWLSQNRPPNTQPFGFSELPESVALPL